MSVHSRARGTVAAVAAILALALLLSAFTPSPATAATTGRTRMLGLTNRDRDDHDRRALSPARRLSRYAEHHSEAMADKGYLFHSSEDQLRGALRGRDWSIAGENVGVGGSLETLEDAFMASKLHRQNILRPSFQRAAVGVVHDGGRYWVTVIFYG